MGDARPLFKVDRDRTISGLKAELAAERRLRVAAEKNAVRFHALMLQARVALITRKKDT